MILLKILNNLKTYKNKKSSLIKAKHNYKDRKMIPSQLFHLKIFKNNHYNKQMIIKMICLKIHKNPKAFKIQRAFKINLKTKHLQKIQMKIKQVPL